MNEKLNESNKDRMKMNYVKILVGLMVGGWLANGSLSAQEKFSPAKNGYKLVWHDDFKGSSLDTSKWDVRGIGPRRMGFISADAVRVENGFLKLYALNRNDSILSGAVGSQRHFCPRYGYFECRAQLQKSIGVWAAFWIQSAKISQGSDPAEFGTEIDIFEYFKEVGKDTLQHALHWAYGPHMKSVGPMNSYVKDLDKGFHTFGLEWTPEKYVFYVDGKKSYERTEGISHIAEYIILSMELPDTREQVKYTSFPDVFVVDYVKVYQKE